MGSWNRLREKLNRISVRYSAKNSYMYEGYSSRMSVSMYKCARTNLNFFQNFILLLTTFNLWKIQEFSYINFMCTVWGIFIPLLLSNIFILGYMFVSMYHIKAKRFSNENVFFNSMYIFLIVTWFALSFK